MIGPMSTPERARARLAALEAEAAALREWLAFGKRHGLLEEGGESTPSRPKAPTEAESEESDDPAANAGKSATEVAREVLQEAGGKALSYRDVFRLAQERGFQGQQGTMRRTLGKYPKIFERVGEGTGMYRLKSR